MQIYDKLYQFNHRYMPVPGVLRVRKTDGVLADQGDVILVIVGCDEVLADQRAAILVIVGQKNNSMKHLERSNCAKHLHLEG